MTTARSAFKTYVTLTNSEKAYYVVKSDGSLVKCSDRTGAKMAAYEYQMKTGQAAEILTESKARKRGFIA
jgi:hypothetical protein